MRYYRLHIDTNGSSETYNKISKLLKVEPVVIDTDNSKCLETCGFWTYEVKVKDEDSFDFINSFLDILESKFVDLENLGIAMTDIIFWLLYEYDQQCAMEFHPQEMKRLGESGIHLNIDCWH